MGVPRPRTDPPSLSALSGSVSDHVASWSVVESSGAISLRPATLQDSEWVYALHKRTMREYVAATFGAWEDNYQRQMHDAWFDPARLQVVEVNGEATGVLDVDDRGEYIYVRRIEIAPEWQNHGIGSTILNGVMSLGLLVQLHVFHANLKARMMYERLGFLAIADEGDRVLMRYAPS